METIEEIQEVKSDTIPKEIMKWNWGAFIFSALWGIGHKVYLPLLSCIPLLGIVWMFVCGAKGNQWLWEKGSFSSVEEFVKMQSAWNRAGKFVSIIFGILFIPQIIIFIITLIVIPFAISG